MKLNKKSNHELSSLYDLKKINFFLQNYAHIDLAKISFQIFRELCELFFRKEKNVIFERTLI